MDTNKKYILINRMFTGGYISSGRNLAHETINMYKDDNGRNFIYVQAYGTVAKKYCEKDINGILHTNIDSILLVKPSGKNTWEIMAKAEGLTPLVAVTTSWKKEREQIHKDQYNYINNQQITYNGVPLYSLFSQNDNDSNAIYYTFQAEKVVKVKEPIYITPENNNCEDDNTMVLRGIKNFAKSSLKMYVEKGCSKDLDNIIYNSDDLWGKEVECITDVKNLKDVSNNNFLKVIEKENDELIFSSLFKYVFDKKPQVTKEFFNQLLNADISEDFEPIEREVGDIDLLLYDNNNVIVIENKIKSGINGKKDDRTQLDKYYEYITEEKHKLNDEENDDDNCEENKHYGKKPYFCIFKPDYNKKDIPKTTHSDKYVIIKYSEIYKFFEKYHYEFNGDSIFDEFFAALEKHTKRNDSSLEDDMNIMFSKHIEQAKMNIFKNNNLKQGDK